MIKRLTRLLLKIALTLNTFSCKAVDRLSIILNQGIHPKHRITKYKEWFLEHIEPGWVVLDIGCNTGLMPHLMAGKAKFVYAIEISQQHIIEARLKKQRINLEYICADATQYDFSRCRKIDCITLSNVLEHIDAREEFLRTLIRNVNWNDRNRKRFLFRVPMLNRDWLVLYKKEMGLDYRSDKTHHIEYTFEEFEKELLRAGISIVERSIRFGEIYAVCEAA